MASAKVDFGQDGVGELAGGDVAAGAATRAGAGGNGAAPVGRIGDQAEAPGRRRRSSSVSAMPMARMARPGARRNSCAGNPASAAQRLRPAPGHRRGRRRTPCRRRRGGAARPGWRPPARRPPAHRAAAPARAPPGRQRRCRAGPPASPPRQRLNRVSRQRHRRHCMRQHCASTATRRMSAASACQAKLAAAIDQDRHLRRQPRRQAGGGDRARIASASARLSPISVGSRPARAPTSTATPCPASMPSRSTASARRGAVSAVRPRICRLPRAVTSIRPLP